MKASEFVEKWIEDNSSFDCITAESRSYCNVSCPKYGNCDCIDAVITNMFIKLKNDIEDAERRKDI